MSDSQSTETLASEHDVAAAVAAAEAAGSEIPTLDDASVVVVPVETAPAARSHNAAAPARPPNIGVMVGQAEEAASAAAEGASAAPLDDHDPLWYRVVDQVLSILDLPFRGMSVESKKLVMIGAMTSLAVSIAAVFLFPLLMPRPDPIKDLHARSAAAQAKQAQAGAAAAREGGEGEGGGQGEKPKEGAASEGHGGGKSPAPGKESGGGHGGEASGGHGGGH